MTGRVGTRILRRMRPAPRRGGRGRDVGPQEVVMRQTIMGCAFLASAVMAAAPAAAKDGPSLEGTWVVSVQPEQLLPPFTALETYSRGGGLVTGNDTPGNTVHRAGQGSWARDRNTLVASIVFFTFDAS